MRTKIRMASQANIDCEEIVIKFIDGLPCVDRDGYKYWQSLSKVALTASRQFSKCVYFQCEESHGVYALKDMRELNGKIVHKSVVKKYEKMAKRIAKKEENKRLRERDKYIKHMQELREDMEGCLRLCAAFNMEPYPRHVEVCNLPYPPLTRKQKKVAMATVTMSQLQFSQPNKPYYVPEKFKQRLINLYNEGTVDGIAPEHRVMIAYWFHIVPEVEEQSIAIFKESARVYCNGLVEEMCQDEDPLVEKMCIAICKEIGMIH